MLFNLYSVSKEKRVYCFSKTIKIYDTIVSFNKCTIVISGIIVAFFAQNTFYNNSINLHFINILLVIEIKDIKRWGL